MTLRRTTTVPIASCAVVVWLAACGPPAHLERNWTAFGQSARAEVYSTTESGAEGLLDGIEREVAQLESVLGPDSSTSELAVLNREASRGQYLIRDRGLYRCLRMAMEYAEATGGAFDPTVGVVASLAVKAGRPVTRLEVERSLDRVGWGKAVLAGEAFAVRFRVPGMELDLGGVDKGCAIDAAARTFSRPGARAGLLQLGPNLYAWGSPPGSPAWTVRLEDPRDLSRTLLDLDVRDRGVAVSRRWPVAEPVRDRRPVLDPGSGMPAAGDVLVAVAIADGTTDADAMATALVVAGSRGAGTLLSKTRRVESILVVEADGGNQVLASASLRGSFALSAELEREISGRVRYLLPPAGL